MKSSTEVEELPPFAEQMAQQLGGWKGLVESGIPVIVFVVSNIVLGWADLPGKLGLQISIIAAVVVALAIAGLRFARKESVRFAINGLFGIALGAYLAWNSGEERQFYLPGIWITLGYTALLIGSIVIGHPLVGWIWTVISNGGKGDWRADEQLKRAFGWLTALWAATFAVKAAVQYFLYAQDMASALGVSRIVLGYPLFALLFAITIWAVRRVTRRRELLAA
ncbi:DUF3159 domain-containing protein [Catelliglobosispora koreensis]|uniref:DUF3159 domain-containing protein n=1 Tax=Catelliglobosispora koreensis TaxID=129052 RepID=UPI000368144D|nr:DUF3159 domain-containing protein [Catelliglobosispora koreensis]